MQIVFSLLEVTTDCMYGTFADVKKFTGRFFSYFFSIILDVLRLLETSDEENQPALRII